MTQRQAAMATLTSIARIVLPVQVGLFTIIQAIRLGTALTGQTKIRHLRYAKSLVRGF